MATMVDLLTAARAAGLPVEVTPDFGSNGHNGIKTLSPKAGYLHHTVATKLVSVYKAPAGSTGWDTAEWRPSVPSPRCQVYAARARTGGCRLGCPYKGKAHLVFVSAGVAYQAGEANGGRINQAVAGKISAGTPDAAASGLVDTMDANDETMGVEIDWNVGEDWPTDLLEIVCRLMALAVKTFRWPGVGSWIRHRQATKRKTDPQTSFDFWARAQAILTNGDDPLSSFTQTDLETAAYNGSKRALNEATGAGQVSGASTIKATLASVQGLVNLVNQHDSALTAGITDAKTTILAGVAAMPTGGLTDEQITELAGQVAEKVSAAGVQVDADALAEALATDLSARLAA